MASVFRTDEIKKNHEKAEGFESNKCCCFCFFFLVLCMRLCVLT